jgi:hypothetical protein
MRDRAEESIQGYREWFANYRWSWIATLKLTSGVPKRWRVKQLFEAWISALRNEEGDEKFRWVRVIEPGRRGTNPHVHVLIGGLRNRMKTWENRWAELGGEAMIRRFDPKQEGILYMLKTTGSDGDLDIDYELPKSESSDDDLESTSFRAEAAVMLRIEGIGEQTNLRDLRRLCENSARILGITLHSVGGLVYALVAVARAEAEQAVEQLDQKLWRGTKIRVTAAGP